jgi:hypothetical protein
MTSLAGAAPPCASETAPPAVFSYSRPPRAGFNWPYAGTLALRLMIGLSLAVSLVFWIGVLAVIIG